MVRRWLIVLLALLPLTAEAQEVLLPLQCSVNNSITQAIKQSSNQAVSLPFFDDFAAGGLSADLWDARSGASVTFDVSPLAPTVGVATLDALDADGCLYPQAATTIFPADTLMSLPIRLDSLTPDDLVLLGFYYLPGGGHGNMWERVGEAPDPQDSLFLDFYRPSDSTWVTVWSTGGISVDSLMSHTGSAWQYVSVRIGDSAFFDSTFRFRFRNYASLESSPKAGKAGNGDFWHLDYVWLHQVQDGETSLNNVPDMRDVAFAAPAPMMLRNYRTMPYRQYTPQDMAPSLQLSITNLYSSPLASQYVYTVLDSAGTLLYHYDGGFENAPPFLPAREYQSAPMHAAPTVSYTFPMMTEPTSYTVVHVVREGTAGDAYPLNDTVLYHQRFDNCFAYDDGTAENGYGLTSTASRLYLAYRFDLNTPDTLTAVDFFFNRTLDDGNAAIPFYLTVWRRGDDGRPAEVLYRDEMRRMPQFGGFARYLLETPVVVENSIFVGFEQSGNDYINLGFDRSLNTSDRIWYLTGTEWQQSILSGSLMLRPCFGSAATVGIENSDLRVPTFELKVYPNPAKDIVHIEGLPDGSCVELYDTFGRKLFSKELNTDHSTLTTDHFPSGLYLLRAVTPDGETCTRRLIIHH